MYHWMGFRMTPEWRVVEEEGDSLKGMKVELKSRLKMDRRRIEADGFES
jgi:hypothetical protein